MKQVYIIGSERGPIKIGISHAPEERLLALATAGFGRLCLVHATAPTARAREIEKAAHRTLRLARRSVEGETEWFDVSIEVARGALDVAQQIVDGKVLDLQHAPRPLMRYLQIRLGDEDRALLDAIRRVQPDIPTRSEMARRCIAIVAEQRGKAGKWKRK